MFDLKAFETKISNLGASVKDVAVVIGCNESTLYRKMRGKSDFTRNEIQLFRQEYQLTADEIDLIFFA